MKFLKYLIVCWSLYMVWIVTAPLLMKFLLFILICNVFNMFSKIEELW